MNCNLTYKTHYIFWYIAIGFFLKGRGQNICFHLSLKPAKLPSFCERQIPEKNLDFPEKFPLVTSPNEESNAHKMRGASLDLNLIQL